MLQNDVIHRELVRLAKLTQELREQVRELTERVEALEGRGREAETPPTE